MLQEAYRLQLRCFLGLVHEQGNLPNLKAFLKLYTTIGVPKLASLMEMDETSLRGELMLLKVRNTTTPYLLFCLLFSIWAHFMLVKVSFLVLVGALHARQGG